MKYTVYYKEPEGFVAARHVAGCHIMCGNRFLLLRRHPRSSQGNTWGIPAGKLEKEETPVEAVIREIEEEIGLDITANLQEVGKLYITHSGSSYIFYLFHKKLTAFPEIVLCDDENVEFRWVTYDEAATLPLIMGGKEALEFLSKTVVQAI
jgi:8-oxo-dGTP pyrophosphatase MutT (NUDIX family)